LCYGESCCFECGCANIKSLLSTQSSFGYELRSGNAGSYGTCRFNFLKNCHTEALGVFNRGTETSRQMAAGAEAEICIFRSRERPGGVLTKQQEEDADSMRWRTPG
jgi:hypothetical protein